MLPPGSASVPGDNTLHSPAPDNVATTPVLTYASNPPAWTQVSVPGPTPAGHSAAEPDPRRVPPQEADPSQPHISRTGSLAQGPPQSITGSHPPALSQRPPLPVALTGDTLSPVHQVSSNLASQPSHSRVPPRGRLARSPDAGPDDAESQVSHSRPELQSRKIGRRPTGTAGDWIIPNKLTVHARITPTLRVAEEERKKCLDRANRVGMALNIAIGLQLIIGSLTTGLSAVATTGKQTAIQTTVLGALSTLVASFLARARGSGEPDLSQNRAKDLDRFIRELRAFDLDHGQELDNDKFEHDIEGFRLHLEQILGHTDKNRNPRAAGGQPMGAKGVADEVG